MKAGLKNFDNSVFSESDLTHSVLLRGTAGNSIKVNRPFYRETCSSDKKVHTTAIAKAVLIISWLGCSDFDIC